MFLPLRIEIFKMPILEKFIGSILQGDCFLQTYFTRVATVPRWTLAHFHSSCNTFISRIGDGRFKINRAQPGKREIK